MKYIYVYRDVHIHVPYYKNGLIFCILFYDLVFFKLKIYAFAF